MEKITSPITQTTKMNGLKDGDGRNEGRHNMTNQEAYEALSKANVHWDRKDSNHIVVWTSGYMNGYTNYETWNVALWISNDEGLYGMAQKASNYQEFCHHIAQIQSHTPDGVRWDDDNLDVHTLDQLIQELQS